MLHKLYLCAAKPRESGRRPEKSGDICEIININILWTRKFYL